MQTRFRYTCPYCSTHDEMKLLLARKGEYQNQYFYTCVTNNCKFYLNTHLNTSHDFTDYETWDCDLYSRANILSCEDCINCVKINMLDILSEFSECNWAGHQWMVLNYIIKPHLDNLELLKFFLKSTDTIIDTYYNTNGYKMYDHFHSKLLEVENIQIKEFVKFQFGEGEILR